MVWLKEKNRTLQEMSRTMLNEQALPQNFWCNAVDTSTYILNRILITAILGKTPYELLKGRKPTQDYFRVFGSKCFIFNTKDYLTKFNPKSYGDTVMSDSEDSTVTYTEVSSPFEGLSDIDQEFLTITGLRVGSKEPKQAPPLPDFVLEPVYPEFMPLEDEVFPAEEQPLPAAVSPTANSPRYVPESDSEEDPADGEDDGDDEDESSDDDKDDDVDIEGDEEEEEHPAPVDSIVVALPAIDHAPSAEETEPFKTDESAATPPPHPA
ncbi:retrovirus-related pol polyprotein from transposon TNT 1-94 [Tanacetum coccineum]|uniref:Retrovirus-related pol polyprotein from transposon TNT 1-94 n=1 Tax=Tanacetum coccineum TaxID=301880 RepID=A0ABQ5BDQ1_9ASTR